MLNGMVSPGDTVAIVGAGPIGLAAILAARLYTPWPDRGDRPGRQPARDHLETLWSRDVTVTTGLVDTHTIPRLMKLVASGRLDPTIFATHRFALDDTMAAYDTFSDAASTHALKVVLEGSERARVSNGHLYASILAGAA